MGTLEIDRASSLKPIFDKSALTSNGRAGDLMECRRAGIVWPWRGIEACFLLEVRLL